MLGKTIEEINVGDSANFTKSVTDYDVYSFAGVTGDFNPAHINTVYASETSFHKTIAHGIVSVGFISNILGTQLPGPGSITVSQECDFRRPVYIGDTITATVEVTKKDEAKNRVWLRTYCTNQRGELVVDGEAKMMPVRKKPEKG
ncbi:MAG: (de)hydratase mit MaoC domain [Firmicutes bacterium]|nr:(de)hydratase mit MaoC domain [Bacillota bacterium]